mmetsp:Transcript_26834/g.45976  ORF Transcript_26834/g.45976 Transcript_26834/m.45976 type:complete len:92 (-) Transcript_26834:22-297(-)
MQRANISFPVVLHKCMLKKGQATHNSVEKYDPAVDSSMTLSIKSSIISYCRVAFANTMPVASCNLAPSDPSTSLSSTSPDRGNATARCSGS